METNNVCRQHRDRLSANQPVPMVSALPLSAKPKLLDQVRQAIRTRHYSPRTEETYVHWIRRFIFFHDKRHPAEMAAHDVVPGLQPANTAGTAERLGSRSYIGAWSFWHCR